MGSTASAKMARATDACKTCGGLRENLPATKFFQLNEMFCCIRCSAEHMNAHDKMRLATIKNLRYENAELKNLRDENAELKKLRDENAELQDLNASANFLRHGFVIELHRLNALVNFLRLGSVGDKPENMQHSDIVIVIQGKTDELVHAHKCILSRKSHVFSTMFNVTMKEKETGIISIDDATLPVIRAMVNFCYNGQVTFTDEVTAEQVMNVAHKYQISLLQDICEKHLIETLNKGNLPERLKLAKKFDARDLSEAGIKLLKTHFLEFNVINDVLMELC